MYVCLYIYICIILACPTASFYSNVYLYSHLSICILLVIYVFFIRLHLCFLFTYLFVWLFVPELSCHLHCYVCNLFCLIWVPTLVVLMKCEYTYIYYIHTYIYTHMAIGVLSGWRWLKVIHSLIHTTKTPNSPPRTPCNPKPQILIQGP